MKKSDAIKLITGGYLGFIAEYRGGKPIEIPYVSKKSGKSMIMKKAQHTVEVNGEALVTAEMLKDETDMQKWQPPLAKGAPCFVHLKQQIDSYQTVLVFQRVEALQD